MTCAKTQDKEMSIHVMCSLACNLSIQELGFDPTICVLTDMKAQKLTENTGGYPHTVVPSGGNNHHKWCTIGLLIWTSLSFLGCGTNIWLVCKYVDSIDQKPLLRGNDMIMKPVWHNSARMPKSDIYMLIDQPLEGLPKFECGRDVMFDGYHITVQNLHANPVRNFPLEGIFNSSTPIPHCLILHTVKHLLWEYTSDCAGLLL